MGSLPTFTSFQPNAYMNSSLVAIFGPMTGDSLEALDSGSDLESEASTISSSPTSSLSIEDRIEPTLDEALLREKFSKLGIDLGDSDSPRISVHGSSDGEESYDGSEEDDDQDSERLGLGRTPLIRSTSLKSGKTPPSTPRRKKIVRFADSLGLDLAAVRHILQDDLPHVPQSAYVDLKVPKDWAPVVGQRQPSQFIVSRASIDLRPAPPGRQADKLAKSMPPWLSLYQQQQHSTLIPEFMEPFVQKNFLDRVRSQMVCLENCYISSGAGSISVTCVMRVCNISFEKQVLLRFSANEWTTWTDCLASYIPQSCDGWSDRFTASFNVNSATGGTLAPGQRVLFAVKYMANNEEYWDNNMGLNYSLIYRL